MTGPVDTELGAAPIVSPGCTALLGSKYWRLGEPTSAGGFGLKGVEVLNICDLLMVDDVATVPNGDLSVCGPGTAVATGAITTESNTADKTPKNKRCMVLPLERVYSYSQHLYSARVFWVGQS